MKKKKKEQARKRKLTEIKFNHSPPIIKWKNNQVGYFLTISSKDQNLAKYLAAVRKKWQVPLPQFLNQYKLFFTPFSNLVTT